MSWLVRVLIGFGRWSDASRRRWCDSAVEGTRRPFSTRLGKMAWAVVGAWLPLALTPAVRAERLTVATYNLENYLSTDRVVEGTYQRDYPKPEVEKTALRTVIKSLNADVIAFQEMGPLPYLNELQHDLADEGCNYPHAELIESDDADRHVAVLSKRPFKAVKKHTDLEFGYFGKTEHVKRGLLEVSLQVGSTELTLFAVHLKSRFTDRSDDPMSAIRRAAEAGAVRNRILALFPDPSAAHFIILGDFNDVPRSRPIVAMSHKGKTVISELLPSTDSRGEVWTHNYHKEDSYSRIDYILVSPGLKDAVVDGRARIADGPETLVASDHRPVVTTLELK